MEVVVLLVAIVGVALIAIPRLQRRNAGGRRPFNRARTRKPRRVVAASAITAPAAADWAPPPTSTGPDLDAWEDDLGWEGVDAPSPAAREAWEDWRSASLASPPESAPAPEPEVRELPSVERWRARAEEDADWVEDDDDGLGWEGEDEPPPSPGLWNGNGHSAAPDQWSGGGAPASSDSWTRANGAQPPVAPGSARALATASATDIASASASRPEPGHTVALDEAGWDPPITRTWGAAASRPAAAPARTKRSRVHPVVLVALYAAVGIGLVVLLSTVLLGGSAEPRRPAARTNAH